MFSEEQEAGWYNSRLSEPTADWHIQRSYSPVVTEAEQVWVCPKCDDANS